MVPVLKGPFARGSGAGVVERHQSARHPPRSARRHPAARAVPRRSIASSPNARALPLSRRMARAGVRCALVAGGVWSRDLVTKLGLRVLLDAERGYNTTWSNPGFEIALPVFFRTTASSQAAARWPSRRRRRRACPRRRTAEFRPRRRHAGEGAALSSRSAGNGRARVDGRASVDAGFASRHRRPPREPRIVFAFGHGHLGLTFSAVTARHVAGLIAGAPKERNLAPFGIERFQ